MIRSRLRRRHVIHVKSVNTKPKSTLVIPKAISKDRMLDEIWDAIEFTWITGEGLGSDPMDRNAPERLKQLIKSIIYRHCR